MSDTLLAILSFAWAYSLRAAWTGGIIYGWLQETNQPMDWPRLWSRMVLWPWTLIIGRMFQKRMERERKNDRPD